jgi:hypothetical protein
MFSFVLFRKFKFINNVSAVFFSQFSNKNPLMTVRIYLRLLKHKY